MMSQMRKEASPRPNKPFHWIGGKRHPPLGETSRYHLSAVIRDSQLWARHTTRRWRRAFSAGAALARLPGEVVIVGPPWPSVPNLGV